ncbi:unnamed protein product [Rhizophagus irregularis]|nr:unnamed protein product [Rhizophagus irregularis]
MIEDEDDDDNRSNSVDNRTPENQANSNDEIRATNTQDNLENQSNANSGDDTNVQEKNPESKEYIQGVCEDRNKQDQAGEII